METEADSIPREDLDELDRWVWDAPAECEHEFQPIDSSGQQACMYCNAPRTAGEHER